MNDGRNVTPHIVAVMELGVEWILDVEYRVVAVV